MSKNYKIKASWPVVWLFFLAVLPGCFEPEEGCLNVSAANFDIDADESCGDCCTFPTLSVDFQHRIIENDTLVTNLTYEDSLYSVDGVNFFRVQNIQFYISDLRLIRSDFTEYTIVNSLEVDLFELNGDSTQGFVKDDIALVNRNTFSTYQLGDIAGESNFVGVRMLLGLDDELNRIDPESLAEDHPLLQDSMYISQDSGYVFNRLDLYLDAQDTEATRIEISQDVNALDLGFPVEFALPEGFSVEITFQIDYLTWFQGIDFQNDSVDQIRQIIVENLPNSLSIVEITLSSG